MRASVARSIERSCEYLDGHQADLALASIAGLADHLDSLVTRKPVEDAADEFTHAELRQILAFLRTAAFDILTQKNGDAHHALDDASALLLQAHAADAGSCS